MFTILLSPMNRFAAAAALISLSFASSLPAQEAIPLKRGPGRLRTIQVRVGRDTVNFLFDTGGGVTVISPRDSEAIGCVPGGVGFGVRLTGEVLSGRLCANVKLGVGSLEVTEDAGVMGLAKLLGPRGPAVRGLISLASFRGRLLTVDLAHDRLVLETPSTFAERTRGMTEVPVRLATGEGGGQLTAYVGVRAQNGAMLWMEWDSGNMASTLVAPYAVALLGGDTTQRANDLRLSFAEGLAATVPSQVKKDMIHDGVLSAAFVERAVWSLDLERGRMFVGPISPVIELPASSATGARTPREDPLGTYESVVMVGGHPQRAVIRIERLNGALTGRSRPIGEDDEFELRDIATNGNELSYRVMIPNPVPVHLTFEGLRGTGTWGDGGVTRGGTATAVKRE